MNFMHYMSFRILILGQGLKNFRRNSVSWRQEASKTGQQGYSNCDFTNYLAGTHSNYESLIILHFSQGFQARAHSDEKVPSQLSTTNTRALNSLSNFSVGRAWLQYLRKMGYAGRRFITEMKAFRPGEKSTYLNILPGESFRPSSSSNFEVQAARKRTLITGKWNKEKLLTARESLSHLSMTCDWPQLIYSVHCPNTVSVKFDPGPGLTLRVLLWPGSMAFWKAWLWGLKPFNRRLVTWADKTIAADSFGTKGSHTGLGRHCGRFLFKSTDWGLLSWVQHKNSQEDGVSIDGWKFWIKMAWNPGWQTQVWKLKTGISQPGVCTYSFPRQEVFYTVLS